MLVGEAIHARLGHVQASEDGAGGARLPTALKSDRIAVRTAMLRRLAASRQFAIGDRAGVLRTAQARSGRPFQLDVRQRVIVKALISRHIGKGVIRGEALAKHVGYLGRPGAGVDGARPDFFDRAEDELDAATMSATWATDRHHFRLIISPEHGDRIADLKAYTREVMRRVAEDLGQPELEWIGTCHFDTDQPHAHVLVRGRRADGKDLVIPRAYVAYGIRARAQEVARELLGDLSRADAERRIWRETEAERFTRFDRRLVEASDETGLVDDGVGGANAWSALTRGRLRHLERLGLAHRQGARFRLDPNLERRLRALELQKDIIRLRRQRQLDGGRDLQEVEADHLRGRVVRSGWHDELGAAPFLIVRDADGIERHARLRLGQVMPNAGSIIELIRDPRGAYAINTGRGLPDRGR